jgi:hypothetical protein
MEKRKLPNASAVLILGIFSIVTCCGYGLGIVMAVIALVLAAKDSREFRNNPDMYTNYPTVVAGKILSIIGLVIGAFFLAFALYFISLGPEGMRDFQHNLELKLEQQRKQQEDGI